MPTPIRYQTLTKVVLASLISATEAFVAKNATSSFSFERNPSKKGKLDIVARDTKRAEVDRMPTELTQKTSDKGELDVRIGGAKRLTEYVSAMKSWKNLMSKIGNANFFFSLNREKAHVAFGAMVDSKILGDGKPTTLTAKFYQAPPAPRKDTEKPAEDAPKPGVVLQDGKGGQHTLTP